MSNNKSPKNILQAFTKHFRFHSKKDEQGDEMEKIAAQEQKVFAFETLVSATKDFHPDNKLGQGGFGPVFKGKLNDGRIIAVKKLSQNSGQGKKEFMNEAKLLSRVQHRNVVNLLGYCSHEEEKLLVYEYVANESLDKFLFNSGRRGNLDWKRRYDTISGVARDFGMARLYPEDQTHVNTRVAGTNGYMAPEYVMHGKLSVKADVFSFGVLILELISGQKNSTFSQDPSAQNLLDWAYHLYKKNKSLEIADPVLASSADPDQVAMCIQIGLLCIQSDPSLRPTMHKVILMLSKKHGALEEPTRPGYPGSRYRRSRRPNASSSTPGISSEESQSYSTTTSNSGTQTAGASSSTSATTKSDSRGKLPTISGTTDTLKPLPTFPYT
ncbi:cysteine-rich receptor-like protein kinase 25 [Heracleum sosnowskyi]|uniref:Cysteine-rich receptor-like protein kinase 25 n=1 Tax=Heracleum sosnowskyi TaxID=360622 RepID=A0AAD8MPT3_9APIA|nr:cysteine-rich receptor-like protein kinase 25 [Heracleum sosnowskyi]